MRRRRSKAPEILLYNVGFSLITAVLMVWAYRLGLGKIYFDPYRVYFPIESIFIFLPVLSGLMVAKRKSRALSFRRAFNNTYISHLIILLVYGYFIEIASNAELLFLMMVLYLFAAFIISSVAAFIFCNKRVLYMGFWSVHNKQYYA